MNLSVTSLLTERVSRGTLMIAATLAGLGFLFFGETAVTKILGAVMALLITGLLKAGSELSVQSRQLERALERQSRLSQQMRDLIEQLEHHDNALEKALADARALISRTEEKGDAKLGDLRAETIRQLDILTASVDELVEAQKPFRRHVRHTDAGVRELGLSSSLEGLLAAHESDVKEPGSGGSMSSKA